MPINHSRRLTQPKNKTVIDPVTNKIVFYSDYLKMEKNVTMQLNLLKKTFKMRMVLKLLNVRKTLVMTMTMDGHQTTILTLKIMMTKIMIMNLIRMKLILFCC